MIDVRTIRARTLRRARRLERSFRLAISSRISIPAMEFFMTDMCNLRCENCAASSPFLRDRNRPDLETFVESLSCLSRVIRCDELRVLGGEPLLNRNICAFLRAAKRAGMFGRTKVVTNGLLLPRMSDEFWRQVDIVRISLYPGLSDRLSDSVLESLGKRADAFGVVLEVTQISQFREAVSNTRICNRKDVKRTFVDCREAHEWSCHLLYRNRLYRCSRVHSLDRYLHGIGVTHDQFTELDGVLIDDRPSLEQDLREYFLSKDPLRACSFCFGTSGSQKDHRQLSVAEVRSRLTPTTR